MSDTEQVDVESKGMENKEVEEEVNDEGTEPSSSVAETRRTEKEEAKDLIGQIMEMVTSSVADKNPDTSETDQASQEEVVAGKIEEEEEKAGGEESEEDKQPIEDKVSDDNQPSDNNEGGDNAQSQEEGEEDSKVEDEGREEPEAPQTNTEVAANDNDKDTQEEQPPATTAATETKEEKPADEEVKEIVTPHLLTDEEIIAKGVAESDIEMYRKFHLKLAYGPKKWYDVVKNFTFTTEFIVLSPEEINALLTAHHSPNEDAPEVSDEIKGVLGELQAKLDSTISQFEEGAFIKLCGHSIRDAILDKCDKDHVQEVEDGLQNELEIEQQFVNAYLNWRSWRSMSYRENTRTKLPSEQPRGNVMRRSFRRIRKSFSRPRSASGVEENNKEGATDDDKKDDSPLAEENVKNDENGGKEDGAETKQDPESGGDKEIETNKGSSETDDSAGAVTVEATVEKTSTDEDKNDEGEQSKEDIAFPEEEKEKTSEDNKEPSTTDEEEVKSKPVEDEVKENKPAPEIEELTSTDKPVEESRESTTEEEAKEKRVPPPMLADRGQPFVKVKSETKGNKVLRAFIKATNAMYRITSGEQAVQLLSTSRVIKEDLEQAKVFANISGVEAVLSVQRWHADVSKYPGMQFRMFVYKNKLTGMSQKDDVAYIPNIVRYKSTIQTKALQFFNSTLKTTFDDLESYIVDIFVGTSKIYMVDIYPFYTGTGACLFTWQQNKTILVNGPLEFRHIATPFKNCFTGLQPHWQQICTAAHQKKKREGQQSGKCVLL